VLPLDCFLQSLTVVDSIIGKDESGQRMEAFEINAMTEPKGQHPYYVAVQFHPEYLSRPLRPSPPYVGLLLAASGQLTEYLSSPAVAPRSRQKLSCCEVQDKQIVKQVADKMKNESSVDSLVEPFENGVSISNAVA